MTVEVLTPAEAIDESELRDVRDLLADERYRAWNEQLAEAQFYRGENATASDPADVTAADLLAGVYGYYESESDRLVVVRNESEPIVADNVTLHHELAHALQDQRYDLADPKYYDGTSDEVAGARGIVEGHATYTELRYVGACADGTFECVNAPPEVYAPANEIFRGLPPFATRAQPYTDGAAWVHDLRQRGGAAAVDAVFENPPVSTEQTIHTGRYPDETPSPLPASGGARNGWTTFEIDEEAGGATDVVSIPLGGNGTVRVGELGLFGMFAYRTVVDNASVIDLTGYESGDNGRYDFYNYSNPATNGWGNDRLIPYRKPTGSGTEYGYVWETAWDSERDAEQFRHAYLRLLAERGARRVGERTYVVPEGPFADAFAVVRNETRVTIVNGPARSDLADLRPEIVAGGGDSADGGSAGGDGENATAGSDWPDDARPIEETGSENATRGGESTPSGGTLTEPAAGETASTETTGTEASSDGASP